MAANLALVLALLYTAGQSVNASTRQWGMPDFSRWSTLEPEDYLAALDGDLKLFRDIAVIGQSCFLKLSENPGCRGDVYRCLRDKYRDEMLLAIVVDTISRMYIERYGTPEALVAKADETTSYFRQHLNLTEGPGWRISPISASAILVSWKAVFCYGRVYNVSVEVCGDVAHEYLGYTARFADAKQGVCERVDAPLLVKFFNKIDSLIEHY